MKGIHCFSTRPMLQGRDISGYGKDKFSILEFPDYMLATMLLSAQQWRKTNGPITLYTDKVFYEHLEHKGVLDFWDDVNCNLEDIDKIFPEIDHAVFWSAAKFYCYMIEKAPFVCVDTDLIVWKPIIADSQNCDLMFTHWESIEDGDTNYIPKENLEVSSSYEFLSNYNKVKKGLNMSMTAFLTEDFKNLFTKEAIKFMHHSSKRFDNRYATPEILYMEQILPIQLAIKGNYKLKPLINCTWSPKQFRFIQQDKNEWIFNSFNPEQLCMHLWFHKNYIEKNLEARKEYMDSIRLVFERNFPNKIQAFEKAISNSKLPV